MPPFNDIDLLVVTPRQKNLIRENLNLTQAIIDRDIDALIEWFKQQPHLPQDNIDRDWIERIMISYKWSLERTKEKIDMAFASKNLFPEFFTNMDPIYITKTMTPRFQCIPLPKLFNNTSRIIILKPMDKGYEQFEIDVCYKLIFLITRHQMQHDYFESQTYIFDTRHASMSFYLKAYPNTLKRATKATSKAFGIRVSSIHVINSTKHLEKLLMLWKNYVSPKMLSRVTIHHSLEDLHKCIPKECLPRDYGGNLNSVEYYNDKWNKMLCNRDNVEWCKKMELLKSIESLRPGKPLIDDEFGLNGSFRSINLD